MKISVSTPDKFVPHSDAIEVVSRQMLEAYAIENYRQEKMSLGRVAEHLELTVDEAHAIRKDQKVPLNYNEEDLVCGRRTIEMFLKK